MNTKSPLSNEDMAQFLNVLSKRNEKNLVPVPPEAVRTIEKVSGGFIAKLLTGDSLTLKTNDYMDVQASIGTPMSKTNYQTTTNGLGNLSAAHNAVETKEGKEAIATLKAMKALNEKGIDTTNVSYDDAADVHGMIQAFETVGSNVSNEEDEEVLGLVQAFEKFKS